MNQLLLNLAMAALSQFGGMGRMPGPGYGGGGLPPGLGGGLPPGGGGGSGIPFQPRPQATVLRPSLEVATVAGVSCLERQGSLSAAERTTMLRSQGQLLGWPSDWDRSVSGDDVERLIKKAGGCPSLLQALRRGGLRPSDGVASGGAWGGRSGNGGGSAGGNDSEAEGFGLSPYR
jgi:hypothetical protein